MSTISSLLTLLIFFLPTFLPYFTPFHHHADVIVRGDNPTSIVPAYSGPDPGYVIAESTSGLANRLRVMAAYMFIAEYKYDNAHLIFIWDKNEACPGHFLSLFEPIDTVIFATNQSRYVLDKHSKINYENSFAVFSWIMRMNNVPKAKFGFPSWGDIEYRMHSKYYPTREVMFEVLKYVDRYNICTSSAMHIRETDMALSIIRQSNGRRKPSLQPYIKFVESRPEGESVYLLTDNPATQQFFLETYGPKKILIYSDMNHDLINKLPLSVKTLDDIRHILRNETKPQIGNETLAEDHRHTTLQNTLVDVLIAAHAQHFKAAPFSSLSELVSMFHRIGRQDRGWCKQT